MSCFVRLSLSIHLDGEARWNLLQIGPLPPHLQEFEHILNFAARSTSVDPKHKYQAA
jgi:hypothetical protein